MEEDCGETQLVFGKRVMDEMRSSFVQLNVMDNTATQEATTALGPGKDVSLSTASAAASYEPPRGRELRATKTGHLQRVPSRRRNMMGPQRTLSNLVPEMRRRAMPRDLLFDDDQMREPAKDIGSLSTHSPVTGIELLSSPNSTKKKEVVVVVEESDQIPKFHKSSSLPVDLPRSSTPPPQSSTVTTRATFSVPKTPSVSAREAKKEAAKVEEEKRNRDEQRLKIEEAKTAFQFGHDMCWKMNDSIGALVEYRQSLIIRESLMGKYHEETGRTYFWIAKSLVKLKEYDEALVAFSRSVRIFERVLMKNHKYNKWAAVGVQSVFREMDDEDADYNTYKVSLDASIAHEREGDQCRKKGKLAQAIAEYRQAIDNIEEYHPDAADMYCKIAIICRQQGEFERALEEYRFASEIYEMSLGAEHPETVNTLNQLLEKKRSNQVALALMEKLNKNKRN
jgi:tetratricopeptide (TPR) repeat protein